MEKDQIKSLVAEGKLDEAEQALIEFRANTNTLEETNMKELKVETPKIDTRAAFLKALAGKELSQEERAVVHTGDTNAGVLVPQDESKTIHELKRSLRGLKNYVAVVDVQTQAGNFIVQAGGPKELVSFEGNNSGLAEQEATFRTEAYAIKDYGALTRVARSFLEDQTASFLEFVARDFAKKAVRTENKEIVEVLAEKVATPAADVKAIKTAINTELDPAIQADAVIIVNQNVYNYFDTLTDENGRGLLQPSIAFGGGSTLFGLEVVVLSNDELAENTMYVGSMKDAVILMDRKQIEIMTDASAGFTQNQVIVRTVERFDVIAGDKDAYIAIGITV